MRDYFASDLRDDGKVGMRVPEPRTPEFSGLTPLVSVIIVTYNSAKFISQCLESVMASDYRAVEVIVVDNDSTDGTPSMVRKSFRHANLVEGGTNLRYSGGNNLGIMKSHGKYIFLLNPDATISTNCLSMMVETFARDPCIGVAGCKVIQPSTATISFAGGYIDEVSGRLKIVGDKTMDVGQFETQKDVQWTDGAAMMISRSALKEVGLFDSTYHFYYEEVDLCWRVSMVGLRVVYVPRAVAYHFQGHSLKSLGSSWKTSYWGESRVIFVVKNFESLNLIRWTTREAALFLYSWLLRLIRRDPNRPFGSLAYAYLGALRFLPRISVGRLRNRALLRHGDPPANQA
jgi:GT2 family glycosyltransferase